MLHVWLLSDLTAVPDNGVILLPCPFHTIGR